MGAATVLLLVPYDTQDEDMVGKVYAGVDTRDSVWMLEPRPSRRSTRERTISSLSTATSSTHSSYAFVSDPEISSSFAASLDSAQASDTEEFTVSPAPRSPTLSSADERSYSPQRRHHSQVATSRPVSPGHLLQSLASSYSSLESLHSTQSGRLLTIHLEKEQSIIWPSLIVGPVPESVSPCLTDTVVFDMSHELEHQYNMDPTSLVLIALDLYDIRKNKEEAFEYFVRAWHQAHIPSATVRLVNHYIPLSKSFDPLPLTTEQASRGTTSYYMQCIGSSEGLAQLYVEAGLLHLEGTASTILSTSHSSLSSLRVPHEPQVGEAGADAWKRDRDIASKYFERARNLHPTLEIPSLPPSSEELLMPSIYLREDSSDSPPTEPDIPVIRRRRNKDEQEGSLFDPDPEAKVDEIDNTWYLYIPGTDLMKCVAALTEIETRENVQYDLIILGGLSGRLDQTVHTLSYLHKLRKQRNRVFAVTDESVGWVLDTGEHTIEIEHNALGPTCGLLPVGIGGTILSTRGLRWNLSAANTPSSFDGMVSTSNHLVPGCDQVWVKTSKPLWWTAELRPF
ncbi:hypothetical protein CCMSSC00406_0001999 [Pleurotus cornucopiae]|uniref:Uncharacterized protein n=1 Tax=Pleurotus cornucopiae TaxID=5321 RepID=A0ACB7J4B8_PLECO|nr:hypothetical protein CCMSSC00406_0001999 [Pleurotus cornucopiae]